MRGGGLERLVREHLSIEDPATTLLMQELRLAKRRGHLTAAELQKVCRWKSARAIRHIRANTPHRIRTATSAALATRSERRRVEALVELQGVSLPMASALLTLVEPRRYGVIDIRVWQLLNRHGEVRANRAGVGLSVKNWLEFLAVLRRLSAKLDLPARDVERALFDIHKARQAGTLYQTRRP